MYLVSGKSPEISYKYGPKSLKLKKYTNELEVRDHDSQPGYGGF